MTTTVYYGDNFEPTQWSAIVGNQPEWTDALNDENTTTNTSAPFTTLIRYTLYSDSSTFENWLTWAQKNKLTSNDNDTLYDGAYVLGLIGRWPMLIDDADTDEDMMCVADASTNRKGALCIMTSKTDTTTKTYSFTDAEWNTGLTAYVGGLGDDAATTALSLITDNGTEQAIYANPTQVSNWWFEGFQKFYCEDYSEGVELECRAWSRAYVGSDGTTDISVDGYPRWIDKNDVVFFWFDGNAVVDDEQYYPKVT